MFRTLFFCSLLLFNCSFERIDFGKRVHKLVNDFKKNAAKTYNIEIIHGITGSTTEDIYLFDFMFATYDYVPHENAMLILSKLENNFFSIINSDVSLRPYLHNFPFKHKDIEFAYTYYSCLKGMPPKTFETISLKKDSVQINVFNLETLEHINLYKASYEEFIEDVKRITTP